MRHVSSQRTPDRPNVLVEADIVYKDDVATGFGEAGFGEAGDDRAVRCREEIAAVARARTRLSVPVDELPCLRQLAGSPHADLDAVLGVLTDARRRLGSREAAALEVLLADTDERWGRNLRERMTEAGELLGVTSYHTFRDRKRPGGRSLYDQLLDTLVAELGVGSPTADEIAPRAAPWKEDGRAPTAENRAEDREPEPAGRRRSTPVPAAVGFGVVVLLTVAGLVARALLGGGAGDALGLNEVQVAGRSISFGQRVEGCDIPLGGTMNPAGVPAGFIEGVVDAVADAGGVEATGCPMHAVDEWEGLLVQHFEGGSGPEAWAIGVPGGEVLWADHAIVGSYQRSVDGQLVALAGTPTGDEPWDGHPALWLSEGGVIVGHEPGGPAFWVPGPAVEVWRDAGGPDGELGLPMTDVNYIGGIPHQDFEGGFLEQGTDPGDDLVVMELITPDELESQLADLPRVDGGILRTFDGTAWWIDHDGIRHWIPDGDTWFCVGGDEAVIDMEVDGWVIGALPVGAPASC